MENRDQDVVDVRKGYLSGVPRRAFELDHNELEQLQVSLIQRSKTTALQCLGTLIDADATARNLLGLCPAESPVARYAINRLPASIEADLYLSTTENTFHISTPHNMYFSEYRWMREHIEAPWKGQPIGALASQHSKSSTFELVDRPGLT